jgi:hypothetical protein
MAIAGEQLQVYYAEVEQLLKDTLETAGSKVEQVMVFDHTTLAKSW